MPAVIDRNLEQETNLHSFVRSLDEVQTNYYDSGIIDHFMGRTRQGIKHRLIEIQNKGLVKLRNAVNSLTPVTMTEDLIENDTAVLIVAKINDFTFHLTIYEDEFDSENPEVILNMFRGDMMLQTYYNNLSEIEYVINSFLL